MLSIKAYVPKSVIIWDCLNKNLGCGFRVVQIFTNFVKCEIRSLSGALYDYFCY